MVDVSAKAITQRTATARGVITLPDVAGDIMDAGGTTKKGPIETIARIAGIQGAKRCPDTIPLCHPLPLDGIKLAFHWQRPQLVITATTTCTAKTGVEMEALCAVNAAALTVFDMLKAVSHDMVIGPIELLHKAGGKSGTIERQAST